MSVQGVIGTHRGLINRLLWQYRTFPFIIKPCYDDDENNDSDNDEKDDEEKEEEEGENEDEGDEKEVKDDDNTDVHNMDREDSHNKNNNDDDNNDNNGNNNNDNKNDNHSSDISTIKTPFRPREIVCRRSPLIFVDSICEIFGKIPLGL